MCVGWLVGIMLHTLPHVIYFYLFRFFFSCAHQRVFSTGSGRRGGQDTAAAGQRGGVSTGLRQGVVQVYQRAAGMGGEACQYG